MTEQASNELTAYETGEAVREVTNKFASLLPKSQRRLLWQIVELWQYQTCFDNEQLTKNGQDCFRQSLLQVQKQLSGL